ncbi:hypothetical protein OS493_021351 [Desmophyllum pertusum]|uniref:MYND-type domain-containing protein n=1 Tax=Desmophyllum pertusum TaxID=174260 RepID=A0A9X0CX46_9CNID|nr:hypothetical protein OS493_021351 [Desmophyllum pertusum]
MIGPDAGECDIDGNKIFENTREGIYALQNTTKIVIRNNDIHHNRPFGLSLDLNSQLVISNNKIFENGFWGILAKTRTSAHIVGNVLSGNKCGGIYIGVNFSGRLHLESNIVRDHSGPWIDYKKFNVSLPIDSQFCDFSPTASFYIPPGEKNELYSNPPILDGNKEFNNKEGTYHPREVARRLYSGCTYCRRSSDNGRLVKCPLCHIASYCCKKCQRKHRPKHETLCFALKSRYSLTVDTVSLLKGTGKGRDSGHFIFTSKPIGKGPKLKRHSGQKFIVKIQTGDLNSHPLQMLTVYNQSRDVYCEIQSPQIFNVIMECGVLGDILDDKFTSKKCFFWAKFVESGEKLTFFLDHLAPYQEW